MTLGAANTIALGGLRFTAQGTRVVAENLANADMAGYGLRKTLATGTISGAAGNPSRSGILRDVDPVLLGAARSADTVRQGAQTQVEALVALEQAFGIPGDPGALNTLVTQLDASLHQAATSPDSTAALQNVAQDAARLSAKFNAVGTQIQNLRNQADSSIATDISALNENLDRVATLNKDIQRQTLLGGDPFALMDERERRISEIASLLPVTEIPRDNNRIMLVSGRGEVLVDLEAAEFSFTPTPGIGPSDTRAAGLLSGIALNGRDLSAGDRTFSEGRLGANLDLRDNLAPQAQAGLDDLAMDLLTRFAGPQADSTLASGELGLFTRKDATMLPTDPTGSAQKVRLNPLIDPNTPATLWRLRSGLNAPAPGPSLDPANFARMIDALAGPSALGPDRPELQFFEHVAEHVSEIATRRLGAETGLAYAQSSYSAKQETLAGRGVDTDAQMQDLLRLERAYAANARVLSTIDDMMRQVLEI
ncbi:MAG: flagellar hook-associated protein FlgK [Rhodobacteraceae bacterium]|nr:flagellar hook-associated protein FlgK [Paracoccaceae bacterium]